MRIAILILALLVPGTLRSQIALGDLSVPVFPNLSQSSSRATPFMVQFHGSTAVPHTFPSNVTPGNTIVVCVAGTATPVAASVNDTLGNSYTLAISRTINTFWTQIWFAKNATGGACTITNSVSAGRMCIIELANCSTTSPLDQATSGGNASAVTTYSTANITTTVVNTFLISSCYANVQRTVTAAPPGFAWLYRDDPAANSTHYMVQTNSMAAIATTNSAATANISSTYTAVLAAFK